MSEFVSVDISGIADVTQRLGGIADRMIDETPAMQAIETVMLRSAELNFVEQGRPEPWAPLAASTVKQRRGKGEGIQILRDTGLLMQSLAPGGGEYGIREITPQSVSIGTNRPGAKYLQEGTAERSFSRKVGVNRIHAGMPARPFLTHQPQDIEDYRTIISDHIIHGIDSERIVGVA